MYTSLPQPRLQLLFSSATFPIWPLHVQQLLLGEPPIPTANVDNLKRHSQKEETHAFEP